MKKLQDKMRECEFSKVLLYLLGEEDESEWDRLTKVYNNMFWNMCDMPVKETDNVYVKTMRVSKKPLEYIFLFSTIKKAFMCEKEQIFMNTYTKANISEKNLPVLLGTYFVEKSAYAQDVERFVAEFMRQLYKKSEYIKRQPKCFYEEYSCNRNDLYEYIDNIDEYLETKIRCERVGDLDVFYPRATIEEEALIKFETSLNSNEDLSEHNTMYWFSLMVDLTVKIDISLIWFKDELFKREPPAVERFYKIRERYKSMLLENYCRGFLVSKENRIVIEYSYTEEEEIPYIYVINKKGEKSELSEYTENRLLAMPIDYPKSMNKTMAAAYLMFYMCYPLRAQSYRRYCELHALLEVLRQK